MKTDWENYERGVTGEEEHYFVLNDLLSCLWNPKATPSRSTTQVDFMCVRNYGKLLIVSLAA